MWKAVLAADSETLEDIILQKDGCVELTGMLLRQRAQQNRYWKIPPKRIGQTRLATTKHNNRGLAIALYIIEKWATPMTSHIFMTDLSCCWALSCL